MGSTKAKAWLTTGQLGAAAGVSADSIRHYEKLGLLKKALCSEGGYRIYDAALGCHTDHHLETDGKTNEKALAKATSDVGFPSQPIKGAK
jgi:hypothetical protein